MGLANGSDGILPTSWQAANQGCSRFPARGVYFGPVRVLFALGGLFLVVGLIWLGQGVGLIGGSFMTGEGLWALIGAMSIVLGAFLIRTGFRWRQAASVDDDAG